MQTVTSFPLLSGREKETLDDRARKRKEHHVTVKTQNNRKEKERR